MILSSTEITLFHDVEEGGAPISGFVQWQINARKTRVTGYKEETVAVRGRNVRLYRGGGGPPLLFLHDPFCPSWLPLHEKLAASHEVFVPIHPGFAGSEDHFEEFEEMEDLVFHYLDFCEGRGLQRPRSPEPHSAAGLPPNGRRATVTQSQS